MKKQIVYVVGDFDSEWMRTHDLITALSTALDRSRQVGELLEEFTTVTEVMYDADTNTVLSKKDVNWRSQVNQLMYGIGRP